MMTSSLEELRRQLEKEAGVSPSITWLDQCLRHIREGNNGGASSSGIENVEAEFIWDQIRHSDLRNVIREPQSTSSSSNNSPDQTAAMQLRQAIVQSKMNSSNNINSIMNASNGDDGKYQSRSKVCLPSNFKLMIQLEEVIDATMNSEQQLAAMGGNNLDGVPFNNQYNNINNDGNNNNYGQHANRSEKWRCLKMVFSDGYYSNGLASSNESDHGNDQENNVLYAMETSPISNLTTASVPGTKMMLHGQIQIRFGLLQLCDKNAFVVGGQVPSWKDIWIKAREKAQRERGMGVDPTIKALIWNPLTGDEEDVDEGEGESGDVAAPVRRASSPPPQPVVPPPQPPIQNHTTLPVITPNHSMEGRTQNQRANNNNNNSTQSNSNQSAVINNANTRKKDSNFRQMALDACPKQNRSAANNPYQRSSNQDDNQQNQQMSMHNSKLQQKSNPYASTDQQRQQQQTNPYASLRPATNSTSAAASLATNLSSTGISKQKDDTVDLTESPADFFIPSDITPRVAISSAADSNSSNLSGNLSFFEFKSLLQSLRHNRILYEEYYGKEIIVLCKISSSNENKVFNIVKEGGGNKKSKSKKEKVSNKRMSFF